MKFHLSLDCNLLLSLRCTSKMLHTSKWCFFTLQNAQPLRCRGYLECIETKISQQRQRSQLQEKYGRIDDIICRMFQLSSTFYTLKVWRGHAPNINETHTQPLASRDGAGTLWNLSGEGVADPLSKCAKVRKKRGCPHEKVHQILYWRKWLFSSNQDNFGKNILKWNKEMQDVSTSKVGGGGSAIS